MKKVFVIPVLADEEKPVKKVFMIPVLADVFPSSLIPCHLAVTIIGQTRWISLGVRNLLEQLMRSTVYPTSRLSRA